MSATETKQMNEWQQITWRHAQNCSIPQSIVQIC